MQAPLWNKSLDDLQFTSGPGGQVCPVCGQCSALCLTSSVTTSLQHRDLSKFTHMLCINIIYSTYTTFTQVCHKDTEHSKWFQLYLHIFFPFWSLTKFRSVEKEPGSQTVSCAACFRASFSYAFSFQVTMVLNTFTLRFMLLIVSSMSEPNV